MIPADAKMLTYEQAALRCGSRASTPKQRAKFISRRVAAGQLRATDFSATCKRISELELLKYLERIQTAEKGKRKK